MDDDLSAWVDNQTKENKPAVLLIFEPKAKRGFIYLANAPHFNMPVIVALSVPRKFAEDVGCHMDFLCEDHQKGNLVLADQTTSKTCQDGGELFFILCRPTKGTRRQLMQEELTQTRLRWPDAEVLLLMPNNELLLSKLPKTKYSSKSATTIH
jgi:hypothetical protein